MAGHGRSHSPEVMSKCFYPIIILFYFILGPIFLCLQKGGIYILKQKRSVLVVIVVIMVLFISLMIIGGCELFGEVNNTPEKTVDAYLDSFKNEEFKTFIDLTLGGKDISDEEIEMLERGWNMPMFQGFELIEYEIGETETLNDTEAVVTVNITTSHDSYTDKIRVVKQGGKWYIDY